MIRRLRLRNWRAYDNLDLELGPGATFVVASNGIGKTSLIMGAGWGLFGDASRVDAVDEIRGDADQASVEVELRLPSGRDLAITRTVTPRGRVEVEARLPDSVVSSQGGLDDLLASEFGAHPHVLAQLTIMIHGGAVETFQGEFDLRDHLAGIFGVTPLFDAAMAAKESADEAASALRKVKTTQRSEKRERDDIVAELQSVIDQLGTTNEAREGVASALEEAERIVAVGEEWKRFRAGVEERLGQLRALAERATVLLGRPVTAEDVVESLEDAERNAGESLSAAEMEAASARGKIDLIRTALADLGQAGGVCPTCLRPLSEHQASRAEEEHSRHLRELESVVADADERAARDRAALADVRALLIEVRSLPVPMRPDPEITERDLEKSGERLERLKEEARELDKRLAMLAASGQTLQGALQQLDEEEHRIQELTALYRREGIARAAHDALVETGRAVTTRYIEPLAREVESRWKLMFGSGGLALSPEGHITRQIGGRTLSFASLSGGEKVWALLLTRLLVAGASTRAPFVWLDEPLEHLDPRLRRVVAGTLAKATSKTAIRQVIVTTYESELARQLMEDVPSASLLYVTTSA